MGTCYEQQHGRAVGGRRRCSNGRNAIFTVPLSQRDDGQLADGTLPQFGTDALLAAWSTGLSNSDLIALST